MLRARKRGAPSSLVLCDLAIVAAPVALAFLVWALASWLITGEPFQVLTGKYTGIGGPSEYMPWARSLGSLMLLQLLALEPMLLFLLLLRLFASRRDLSLVVASTACLGATLAFMTLAKLDLVLGRELRYFIVLIPLTVVLAGSCISIRPRRRLSGYRIDKAVALLSLFSVFAALPISAREVTDPTLNPYGYAYLRSVLFPSAENERGGPLNWTAERHVATDVDQLHLASGSVLVDDFRGFPIILASNNPKQFVITSDRDFESKLADPRGAGVQYMLVPRPDYLGRLDALNRLYPGLYESGGGFGTLVSEYTNVGINDSTWRLYRIN
jgi:hypothetical protein